MPDGRFIVESAPRAGSTFRHVVLIRVEEQKEASQ
jgi:hypothetical protein